MLKLFIVVNVDYFFLSHRLPIALAAKKLGYNVTIIARDTGKSAIIKNYGLDFINLPFKRAGSNIFYELKCIILLYRIYRKKRPDLLHHVTIKVSVYGSIAAKFCYKKFKIINAISGLGYNFTDNRNGLIQKLLPFVLKFGLAGKHSHFIFQNKDDMAVFLAYKVVRKEQCFLIKGSGVDLNEFSFTPLSNNTVVKILMPARMLYDKGVMEFIHAAIFLKPELENKAEFILAGDIDKENPAAINEEILYNNTDGSYIKWIGFQEEVYNILKECNIVVLPSYREGLPKSLIEASAVGRPIITTDVPGCRECVIEGYNGFLVPPKDYISLAKALKTLILNFALQVEMGKNSRIIAEREFGIEKVISQTIAIYNNSE